MKSIFRTLYFICLFLTIPLVQADTIKSVLMPGRVIQGHIKEEDNCENCHKHFDKEAQSTLCADCHKDIRKDIADKRGFHGNAQNKKECKECHTEHKGRDADIINLNEKTFKHDLTDYPLKGAHTDDKVVCKDCHKPKIKYRDAPSACIGCHKKDDKHKNTLGDKCADCHIEKNWKEIKFNHDKSDFPLKGAHADEVKVKCNDCHKDTKFKETPKECYACHKQDDKHKGLFGSKCETCHVEKDWKTTHFDHALEGHFALKGAHASSKCESCHKAFKEDLPKTCIGCHRNDDKHKGTLGNKCESCHNERTWDISNFDHSKTDFPLKDKHRKVKCEECHTTGLKFEKVAKDCLSCHKKDDTHKGKFGEKCETCHDAKDWKKSTFDHDRDTKYKLKDKHIKVKCESCHKGNLYTEKLTTDCNSCHKSDDPHKMVFGSKCETCHSERDWKVTSFDHTRDTKYVLKGKHIPAKCESCHKPAPASKKLETTCIACHLADDVHKGSEGKDCKKCHTEVTWKVKDFDHNKTKFPLLGKHGPVECKQCHITGDFKNAKSDCFSCHKQDDIHKQRLGTLCEDCHNARDWGVWDYDHAKRANYKLEGGHSKVECLACHQQIFVGKVKQSKTCISCHQDDDVHERSFGMQCERCHVVKSFREVKIR
jgi:hypothetical protein